MTLGECLKEAVDLLRPCSDEAVLESWMIVTKVTGLKRPVLLSHPERLISESDADRVRRMCARRQQGTPLPYLLEEWKFYGRSFEVNPAVLIPRPETEMLAERGIGFLKAHPEIREALDVGTGSGCIAVTLLLAVPGLECTAVDISPEALETAKRNALRNGCDSAFHPVLGNLTTSLESVPRLICANLPYIPSETCTTLEVAKHEPLTALDGGPDGFELYRALFSDIRNKMEEGTLILCEIEYRQKETALQCAAEFFPTAGISVRDDLAGLPRMLEIMYE